MLGEVDRVFVGVFGYLLGVCVLEGGDEDVEDDVELVEVGLVSVEVDVFSDDGVGPVGDVGGEGAGEEEEHAGGEMGCCVVEECGGYAEAIAAVCLVGEGQIADPEGGLVEGLVVLDESAGELGVVLLVEGQVGEVGGVDFGLVWGSG